MPKPHPLPLAFVLSVVMSSAAHAQAPKTEIIQATDLPALTAVKGTTVQVEGVIESAKWSSSGKVMMIQFEGKPDEALLAAVFEKQRKKFDDAFSGDAAKSFTGAKVRLKGRLIEYDGPDEQLKGRLQLILGQSFQVTIVTPAPETQPTSVPSSPN